jgi:hypothetical protein
MVVVVACRMATGDFCRSTVVTVKMLRSANGDGRLLQKIHPPSVGYPSVG